MAHDKLKVKELSVPYTKKYIEVLQQCKGVLIQSQAIRAMRDAGVTSSLIQQFGKASAMQMVVTFKRIAEQLGELMDTQDATTQGLISDCEEVFGYMLTALELFDTQELSDFTEFKDLKSAVDMAVKEATSQASNNAIIFGDTTATPGVFDSVHVGDFGVKVSKRASVLDMFMSHNVVPTDKFEELVKIAQDWHVNGSSVKPKLELLLLYASQIRRALNKFTYEELQQAFVYFVTPNMTTLAIQSVPVIGPNGVVRGSDVTGMEIGHVTCGKKYKVLMLPFMITEEMMI